MSRSKAKTTILNWYDKGEPTKADRALFAKDIDLFFEELSAREHWGECLSTCLRDSVETKFSMGTKNWRADPTNSGLVVTTIVPGWGYGWRKVFKNEMSEDFFTWLGHFCRQYIHRAMICKVLMAAWEKDGDILHPFGFRSSSIRFDDTDGSKAEVLVSEASKLIEECGAPQFGSKKFQSRWLQRNTLDPSVHQGISHFLRAQSLLKAGFEIEALVALDCTIQSLQNMDWSWASGNPKRSRRDLCRVLGFGVPTQDLSEEIYFLRNQFGAHAGGWRWWDTGEHLGDDVCERGARLASRVLRKAADIEPEHRTIEPNPENWAKWLEQNFDAIWTAVWFKDP
ncbi:hypothetical protein FHS72_001718 [Loktanella ponticola]|uniref:Uncharacterized protein n=1 Tax=Yoonia ponticola TaxID=1524255 RepID=A0A7W9EXX3_9RHOB|nr:hypothetical protein [Yoonia ponticola]MBB5722094.1 hypothetical protein [Yoonia ponticola]